jgi:hypothetical protein
MSIELNHTIIWANNPAETANFLCEILGLPEAERFGPFLVVRMANGVSLDVKEKATEKVSPQHYAFLVSETEFDEIFSRVKSRNLDYWADPAQEEPGTINTRDHGRGFYFLEPSGHYLEILTRPYGSG